MIPIRSQKLSEVATSIALLMASILASGADGQAEPRLWSEPTAFVKSNDWPEVRQRFASDATPGDWFGYDVSISGNTAVVGARYGGAALRQGAAYLFERNQPVTNNWGELKRLAASDAAPNDGFGFSVAIDAATAVVGAPFDDDVCQDVTDCNSGAVYVFERNSGGSNSWDEVVKLTASDAGTSNLFGHAVSISGDTILVGAPFRSKTGDHSGGAYLFQRDARGAGTWGEVAILVPGVNGVGDQFGSSVAISGDTLVVGAVGDGPVGSANVYQRDRRRPNQWNEVTRLTAEASTSAAFGASVAIQGDTAVVGAPLDDDGCPPPNCNSGSAFVFERHQGGTDSWGEVARLSASDASTLAQFGWSVAVSNGVIAVGADRESGLGFQAGAVYLFDSSPGGCNPWRELTKVTASDAAPEDSFGWALALDDGILTVSTWGHDGSGRNAGATYFFHRVGDTPLFIDGFESGDTSCWSEG